MRLDQLYAYVHGKNAGVCFKLGQARCDCRSSLSKAAAGRASYVPMDSLDGIFDPGAEAVSIFFDALTEVNQSGPRNSHRVCQMSELGIRCVLCGVRVYDLNGWSTINRHAE
jgi:hypothetical protein